MPDTAISPRHNPQPGRSLLQAAQQPGVLPWACRELCPDALPALGWHLLASRVKRPACCSHCHVSDARTRSIDIALASTSQGRIIRGQRKGRGSIFTSHTKHRKGACGLRTNDFAERNGYIRGVVKEIIHDPGRGAPVAKIQFADRYKFGKQNVQWTATEGTYTGQFIYCGKKGTPVPIAYPLPQPVSHAQAIARAACS